MTNPEFVSGWFEEWRSEAFGSATQRLVDAIVDEPELAWTLVVDLIHTAPTIEALGWVGAGPLEDLMCDHGPHFIDRVEPLAASDPHFKTCLGSVWGFTRMDPPTYERMRAAAGHNPQ